MVWIEKIKILKIYISSSLCFKVFSLDYTSLTCLDSTHQVDTTKLDIDIDMCTFWFRI